MLLAASGTSEGLTSKASRDLLAVMGSFSDSVGRFSSCTHWGFSIEQFGSAFSASTGRLNFRFEAGCLNFDEELFESPVLLIHTANLASDYFLGGF